MPATASGTPTSATAPSSGERATSPAPTTPKATTEPASRPAVSNRLPIVERSEVVTAVTSPPAAWGASEAPRRRTWPLTVRWVADAACSHIPWARNSSAPPLAICATPRATTSAMSRVRAPVSPWATPASTAAPTTSGITAPGTSHSVPTATVATASPGRDRRIASRNRPGVSGRGSVRDGAGWGRRDGTQESGRGITRATLSRRGAATRPICAVPTPRDVVPGRSTSPRLHPDEAPTDPTRSWSRRSGRSARDGSGRTQDADRGRRVFLTSRRPRPRTEKERPACTPRESVRPPPAPFPSRGRRSPRRRRVPSSRRPGPSSSAGPPPRPGPSSTSSTPPPPVTPTGPPSTTASGSWTTHSCVTTRGRSPRCSPGTGSDGVTGWASGSPPGRPSCTSRSSASSSSAPPTSRSTPTTPTSAPPWSSPGPGSGACSRARPPTRSTAAARRPCHRVVRCRPTTPGSSSPRAPRAPRRASPSHTAARPPSSTPRPGCSCPGSRSAPGTG